MIGRLKARPIGLDLCARSLYGVQLAGSAGAWHVLGIARADRPTEAEAVTAQDLARLVSQLPERGVRGTQIVTALPTNKHFSSLMDIPALSSGAPIGEITRIELCREANKDPKDCETAWWPIPRSGRMNESDRAMVIGCQHADADSVIDPIEKAGLVTRALDLRAAALMRACRPLLGQETQITPILEVGHSSGLITIAVGQTLAFQRRVDFAGTQSMHRLLMTQLGVDSEIADHLLTEVGVRGADPVPPLARLAEIRDLFNAITDRIADEVRSSIGYTTHRYVRADVMPLLLCGDGAVIPGLDQALAHMLSCECKVIRPSHVLGAECHLTDPAMIAAIGLAMHGVAA